MRLIALLLLGLMEVSLAQDPFQWLSSLHSRGYASLQADNTGGECPEECDCPPTFPIAMYCDNRNIQKMPYIPSRMKYVYLQHNQITSVPDNAFGNATNLVWVMLHENHINSVGKQAFAKLSNLNRLYLNNNNLTEVPSNLPRSLRDLRLNHNKIGKLAPNAFEGMENLTILLLHHNSLQDIGVGLKGLKSLTLLDVSRNQLKKVPESLPEMLHQLYLDSNSIGAVPANFLNQFSNLQYVRFAHNELTNKGIPQNTFNNSGLVELDLSFNKLESIPVVSTSLQHLYLQANQIKEFTLGSFCSVVDVMNFSRLRVLRLEGNEIGAGDVPSEAALCLRLASDIAV
ncbi:fibromodulin a precursor [Danio rerio]|uniref:Fibromodulin n=1 Tax=Danio rerio TaxID=7955 RepID=Q4V9E0_DANRE|nr:fibromodulin a precursor [Danio rerio]AAH96939.1 Zgc:113456 [Danio rerio]AAI64382.1 Zgc:113456 protein [Danio rerio]|eukprot:NP_001025243.1 fibromodulin-like precursor [Danio rerio]